MPRDPDQASLPLGDPPNDARAWLRILRAALGDADGVRFLPLAEEAVRACPDDGNVLLLAANAALMDRRPARAQTFLRDFTKHFRPNGAYYLLDALALAQQCRKPLCRACCSACPRCGRAGVDAVARSAASGH